MFSPSKIGPGLGRAMSRACLFASISIAAISGAQAAPVIVEYNIPTANAKPVGLVSGSDGAVWFTEANSTGAAKIGRITSGGIVTEYSLPAGVDPANVTTNATEPNCIAATSDGALWTSEGHANRFTRITTAGVQTQYANFNTDLTGQTSAQRRQTLGYFPNIAYPQCLTVGPDGALWVADQGPQSQQVTTLGAGWITRIALDGTMTRFPVTTPTNSYPSFIVTGSDNALWFSMPLANRIGRMTTAGVVTSFAVPTASANIGVMALGADGAVWFTMRDANKIGRITTAGVITEFTIPTANSAPYGIVAGPDGALWFTELTGNKIGRITTAGVITEYAITTPNSQPALITVGPDNALWYAANNVGKIGKVLLDGSGTVIAPLYTDVNANQSYLRMFSTTSTATNFTVTIAGAPSNRTYGQKVYTVPGFASTQVAISEVIAASGTAALNGGDTEYVAYISAPNNGELPAYQHVLFNGANRFFENLSVCAYTPAVANYRFLNQSLINVHSTRMTALGFPAQVSIHNTGSATNTFSVRIYDSIAGTLVGTVAVPVAARSTYTAPVSWYEQQLGYTPTMLQFHYNMVVLQNATVTNNTTTPVGAVISTAVVNNQFNALLNMSSMCAISQ